MRLTAHQPSYIPWLGLLAKIADADLFCFFDCVPMESSGYENRQRIKTHDGPQWLTVPVKRSRLMPIQEVAIADEQDWRRKHWRTIEQSYSKAPFFSQYAPGFRAVLSQPVDLLVELDLTTLLFLMDAFEIKTPMVRGSEYGFLGAKSGLVANMCCKLGATEYVFGAMGRDYADLALFESLGIKVEFQDYQHPIYRQLHGTFEPRMGAIDLLFNVGGEKGREVLLSGNAQR